jgi:hypothetical protein
MRVHKASLALATLIAALAAASAFDSALAQQEDTNFAFWHSASAQFLNEEIDKNAPDYRTRGFLYRAPQPNQTGATSRPSTSWLMRRGSNLPEPTILRAPRPGADVPSTTSRPSNRDMRGTPSIGSRGMRGGVRMNGGMRRR